MKNKKYTAFFCEENIWHLCDELKSDSLGNYSVLFLTNKSKTIALANQKAAKDNGYIIWDYHVILHDKQNSTVLDFDSVLGFKTPIEKYFALTFGNQYELFEEFRTYILEIPAKDYFDFFSSDRSHMIGEEGEHIKTFPEWPKIANKSNLTLKNLMNLEVKLLNQFKLKPVSEYLA